MCVLFPSRQLHVQKFNLGNDSLCWILAKLTKNPGNIHMFKVNSGNSRKRHEICSKLTVKASKRRHSRPSSVFIFNVENNLMLAGKSLERLLL